MPGKKVCK